MTIKATLLASLLIAFSSLSAHSAPVDDWIMHYYEKPTPDRFVAEVRGLSKAGHLSDPKASQLIAVFLGRVMAANPTQVASWLVQLSDLKGGDRQTILAAAHLSDTRQAQMYLARQPEGDTYRARPVDIRHREAKTASDLDMLWADFFATGEVAPIRRIVGALNYGTNAGALDRYATSAKSETDRAAAAFDAVFKAAMWSLASNAAQHLRVRQALENMYLSSELTQQEKLWMVGILAKAMPEKYTLTPAEAGQGPFTRKAVDAPGAGWRDSNGEPAPNTESMQSKAGFSGTLLATTDDDWKTKWNTPPETKPSFNMASVVPYGKKIYILTFFANPMRDARGQARVTCDIRLIAPGGKVALDQKDASCFAGALQGDVNAVRLSAPVITFSGDANDLPGMWAIEVKLRDAIRNVELPLRTKFELKQR